MATNSNVSITSSTINNIVPMVNQLIRQYDDLQQKYDSLLKLVGSPSNGTLSNLMGRVNTMNNQISSLQTQLNNLDFDQYAKASAVNNVRTAQAQMAEDIATIKTTKTSSTDYETLTNKVNKIESDLNSFVLELGNVSSELDATYSAIDITINSKLNGMPTPADLQNTVTTARQNKTNITSINGKISTINNQIATANDAIRNLSESDLRIADTISTKASKTELNAIATVLNSKADQQNHLNLVQKITYIGDTVIPNQNQSLENYSEKLYNDIKHRINKLTNIAEFLYSFVEKDWEKTLEEYDWEAKKLAEQQLTSYILNDVLKEDGTKYDVDDLNDLINKIHEQMPNDLIEIGIAFDHVKEEFNYLFNKQWINTTGDNTAGFGSYSFPLPEELAGFPISQYVPTKITDYVDSYLTYYLKEKDDEYNESIAAAATAYTYVVDNIEDVVGPIISPIVDRINVKQFETDRTIQRLSDTVRNNGNSTASMFATKQEAMDAIAAKADAAQTAVATTNSDILLIKNDLTNKIEQANGKIEQVDNYSKSLTNVIYGETITTENNEVEYTYNIIKTGSSDEINKLSYELINNNSYAFAKYLSIKSVQKAIVNKKAVSPVTIDPNAVIDDNTTEQDGGQG